jgi:hypothetical protein
VISTDEKSKNLDFIWCQSSQKWWSNEALYNDANKKIMIDLTWFLNSELWTQRSVINRLIPTAHVIYLKPQYKLDKVCWKDYKQIEWAGQQMDQKESSSNIDPKVKHLNFRFKLQWTVSSTPLPSLFLPFTLLYSLPYLKFASPSLPFSLLSSRLIQHLSPPPYHYNSLLPSFSALIEPTGLQRLSQLSVRFPGVRDSL